jgi:serine/threonine protein kinase
MEGGGPFFADLKEHTDSSESEGDGDVDFLGLDDRANDDVNWLLNTIMGLCSEAKCPDRYDAICKELHSRGFINEPAKPLLTRVGSPFAQMYGVMEVLGEGGYGKVLKIRNHIDKQVYALKIVDVERGEMGSAVREVQCLAKLNSSNLVRYYSSWLEEKSDMSYNLFIQMEFIEGQSLAHFLTTNHDRSVRMNRRIMYELTAAVRFLHANGIVHRDLRPANVMFRPDGSIVVIDFGIASVSHSNQLGIPARVESVPAEGRHVGSLKATYLDRLCMTAADKETKTIRKVGTPLYSSPRQLSGLGSVAADDIYSLGVIMYEVFAGFKTEMEKAKAITTLRKQKVFESGFEEKFGAEAEVIRKMLSSRPGERPSAGALMDTELFRSYGADIQCLN